MQLAAESRNNECACVRADDIEASRGEVKRDGAVKHHSKMNPQWRWLRSLNGAWKAPIPFPEH